MKAWVGALLAACLAAAPVSAAAPAYVGAQFRYWVFSDRNNLRDPIVYWVPGPFHVQLEYWDFTGSETHDQFRPEVGIHLHDRRRSAYTLQWRHERLQERFWIGTEQVLSGHVVGRLELSPIVASDSTLWVKTMGADVYWGSWSFASASVVNDPRAGGLWVVPLRLRVANEANDWFQLTFAPASGGTVGWAADVKKKGVRLGVERNNRFDFTDRDNTIVSVGVELPFPARE